MGFNLGEAMPDSHPRANQPSSGGIDPTAAAEFMAQIVPAPGVGHYLSCHTLFKREGKATSLPGKGFTSYNDAANNFGYWLGRQPQDMFFCLSTQGKVHAPKAGKPVPKNPSVDRKIENSVAIKVLFCDLDVKPGAYETQADAMRAVVDLIQRGLIPNPSCWVNSGHGVHVYWILDRDCNRHEWIPVAEGFGNFLMQNGIKADRFFGDMARVLRAPGTLNCKDPNNIVPVKLIGSIGSHRYPLEDFRKFVGTPAPAVERKLSAGPGSNVTAMPVSRSRAAQASGQPSSAVAALVGASMADVTGNVTMLNTRQPVPDGYQGSELASGLDVAAATPVDMAGIVEQCLVLADVLERGGNGDAEPFWRHALYAASFAPDGREWAHRFSEGDPRYSEADTDAKYETILSQRQSLGGRLGWPSCQSFNQFSPKCQSCPFFGRIFSPMNVPASKVTTLDVPVGYERHDGMFWRKMLKKNDNGDMEEAEVCVFAYGLRDAFIEHVPGEGPVINTEVIVPNTVPQRIRVPTAMINTWRDKLYNLFGQYGVSLSKKTSGETQEFFVAFLKMLQDKASAVRNRESFGWTVGRDGKPGFAFGGAVYRADGTREVTTNTEGTLEMIYHPRGDLTKWRRAAETLTTSGRTDLAMIVAASFAAPLIRFTGVSGLLLSAYSPQSGVQKSTAMEAGMAVWGDPKRGMNRLDDTANSVLNKLGTLRHLPIMWDELHNRDSAEPFVRMVFALTQGTEKSRLNADIGQRQSGQWDTMLVAASNFSIQDMMTQYARNTSAGLNRVLELTVQPASFWGASLLSQADASGIMLDLRENYGVAGEQYASVLARKEGSLKGDILKVVDFIQQQLQTTAEERFWVYSAATLLVGARLATAEGIVRFDTGAMWTYMRDLIVKQRANKTASSVDVTAPEYLADILARYIAYSRGRYAHLMTDLITPVLGSNTVEMAMLETEWRSIRAPVSQFGVKDGMFRMSRVDFLAWLLEQKVPQRQIMDGLEVHGRATQKRLALGAGTHFHAGRITALEVDLRSGPNGTTLGNLLLMHKP